MNPQGISRGQQPARLVCIPGPHNVNSQDIFMLCGPNPSPLPSSEGSHHLNLSHTYRITG